MDILEHMAVVVVVMVDGLGQHVVVYWFGQHMVIVVVVYVLGQHMVVVVVVV